MTTTITSFLINDVEPASLKGSIGDVQDLFTQTSYSHIPVVENGVFLGSLAEQDVHCFDAEDTIESHQYNLEPFLVRQDTHWLDILEAFAKANTNIMPVLDSDNTYLGYYELADIMNFFHSTPFLSESGSVVVVEKGLKDYSFSEIAQIVESNDGKVLGAFISKMENDIVEVSIKIGGVNFNEILQSFRRYNYNIQSQHQEDTYLIDLKERSKYLDKYLNI
ncbi:CBS domain-containing protein [Croceiramulus getboli]|nr:acetoin utilization protein acuB [Flavobacteriaceae bacterium YJPT1-3]